MQAFTCPGSSWKTQLQSAGSLEALHLSRDIWGLLRKKFGLMFVLSRSESLPVLPNTGANFTANIGNASGYPNFQAVN